MARAVGGGRDRGGHLDCGAGSAAHPGGTSARPRSGDSSTRNSAPGTGNRELGIRSSEHGTPNPERGTRNANQNPAPSTQNLEPQAQFAPSVRVDKPAAEAPAADARRSETRARSAPGAGCRGRLRGGGAASLRLQRPCCAVCFCAHGAIACRPFSRCASLKEPSGRQRSKGRLSTARRWAAESVSPSNPLIRWRVVAACVGRALRGRRQDVDEDDTASWRGSQRYAGSDRCCDQGRGRRSRRSHNI